MTERDNDTMKKRNVSLQNRSQLGRLDFQQKILRCKQQSRYFIKPPFRKVSFDYKILATFSLRTSKSSCL